MRVRRLVASAGVISLVVAPLAFAGTSAPAATTWSAPVTVTSGAGTLGTSPTAPVLLASSSGTTLLSVYAVTSGTPRTLQTKWSTDGGVTWGTATTVSSTTANVQDFAVAATSDLSSVAVVWIDASTTPGSANVSVTRTSGSTWTGAVAISSASTAAFEPAIAMSADGSHIYSVWTTGETPSKIRLNASVDGGSTWNAPADARLLSTASIASDEATIVTSSDGSKIAVSWLAYSVPTYGQTGQLTYSSNTAATWSTPVEVSSSVGQNVSNVEIAMNGAGSNVLLAWNANAGGVLSRGTTTGGATWTSSPTVIEGTAQVASNSMTLTMDAATGVSYVAWQDNTVGQVVKVGSSADNGLSWTTTNVSGAGTAVASPRLAAASDGKSAQVVWMKGNASGEIMTSSTTDAGASWSSASTLVPGTSSMHPGVAISGDATWRTVNYLNDTANVMSSLRSAPAPTITAVAPSSGYVNDTKAITITGTGFKPSATVKVGGLAATSVSVASATSMTASVPAAAAAGAVDVVVTNVDGQAGTSAKGYTYSALKTQAPAKDLKLAKKIKPGTWTKLIKVPVRMNTGQAAPPVVTPTIKGKATGQVSKKVFKTKRKGGYLQVWSSGRKALSVLLSLNAPPIEEYGEYNYTKTYNVKRK